MSIDIDRALKLLADAPTPPELAGLEAAVLARISAARRSDQRSPLRLGAIAAVGAAVIGLASTGMSAATPQAVPTLSPFGPSMPLAPSTLLADAQ